MNRGFEAAWVPFLAGRSRQAAFEVALEWAERQAAARGRPAVFVVGVTAPNAGPGYRHGRGVRRPVPTAHVRDGAGAVVVAMPTFDLVHWVCQLSAGNALVVVDARGPNRLTGWAGALGALNLDSGQPATLDSRVREYLTALVRYGADGYAEGESRDCAHRLLAEMAAAGLLERAVVLGALVAYGVPASGLAIISRLIDLILPVATWLATPS